MSGKAVQRVAIVGGGTAGWLSAAYLAARRPDLAITLVESPDIATIGVGEGTWPTMRETLATIGLEESEFLAACDGSFKQGSRFDGWVTGAPDDSYLHPFTAPPPGDMRDLIAAWRGTGMPFATAMSPQGELCARGLAPRTRSMPGYAGMVNYAYHLDAGAFARLLAAHAMQRLGVQRIADEVVEVIGADDGDIAALRTRAGETIAADLFLDCSGLAGLLVDRHFAVPWIDRGDVSFNDRALAVQVPTADDSALASQTVGTAHRAGWLWDIALPARRGIGCVYSSAFMDDDAASGVLRDYVARHVPGADAAALAPRLLRFPTGYRTEFWRRNCIAIGLSAGFIEPLEASAIVLVELSLRALADNFPSSREAMDLHAPRFNGLFRYRWERIVEFLKLHYVLSRRDEPYWRAHRDPTTIPPRLAEQLVLWRDQPASAWDFPQVDEVFPAASHNYVLYGMGFVPPLQAQRSQGAQRRLAEVRDRSRQLCAALPSNRTYFAPRPAHAA